MFNALCTLKAEHKGSTMKSADKHSQKSAGKT